VFRGADLSAKLKLLGVDVARFGANEAPPEVATPATFEDPFTGVYKKLLFSHDGKQLLGGILVGDAKDYGRLVAMFKSGDPIACSPGELLAPPATTGGASGAETLGDGAQVC